MRYFLIFSYVGSSYAGWQRQPNALGIQEVIENSLQKVLKKEVTLFGSSRTDAGVHALAQVAHFDTEETLLNGTAFLYRLNALLPQQVAAIGLQPVLSNSHARHSASARRYVYRVHLGKQPFLDGLSYHCHYQLDIESMNRVADIYLSHTDFRALSRSGSPRAHHNCYLRQAYWHREAEGLVFTVSSNRFLRGMVRAMVGLCIDVGRGRLQVSETYQILESKDRALAPFSPPPQGLYLADVHYPSFVYL